MNRIEQLQQQFGIPGVLKIESGPNGFARAAVTGQLADATVYLHGAHVALFQPRGQKPVLFMSGKSMYEAGKAIRGGVPVIFPWFGPHATDMTAPAHGVARLAEWELQSTEQLADGTVVIVLELGPSELSRKYWPHDFRLKYRASLGTTLEMSLTVNNTGSTPIRFEEALHTYFAVSDIRQCSVTGLEKTNYIAKLESPTPLTQDFQPIRFTGETDRAYMKTASTCVLHDSGLNRRIIVEKTGSNVTVVWNPWIAKAKAMPDFGDDEWPGMLCIETVNSRDCAVNLAPGQSHTMSAAIRVKPA
jgi:D-hexose-6-phosphate mutarotase